MELEEHGAQGQMRVRAGRVCLGRALKQLQRLAGPTFAEPQAAQLDQSLDAVAILAQSPGVLRRRLGGAASALQRPSLPEKDIGQGL